MSRSDLHLIRDDSDCGTDDDDESDSSSESVDVEADSRAPRVTEQGLLVHRRSIMPRKNYDFENVPEYADPYTGECANLNPGYMSNDIRACLEDLEENGLCNNPEFLLLVNCHGMYNCLLNNRFPYIHNCVMMWTPLEVATIHFLRLFKKKTKKPIVALVDYDPMSLKLLSFFESWKGNGKLPSHLADVKLKIKWMGLRQIHLDCESCLGGGISRTDLKLNVHFVDMDSQDVAAANDVLNEPFVKRRKKRVAEVQRMIRGRMMLELHGIWFSLLFKKILPSWIKEKNWI